MLSRLACLYTALHKSLRGVNWRLPLTGTTVATSRDYSSMASSEIPFKAPSHGKWWRVMDVILSNLSQNFDVEKSHVQKYIWIGHTYKKNWL